MKSIIKSIEGCGLSLVKAREVAQSQTDLGGKSQQMMMQALCANFSDVHRLECYNALDDQSKFMVRLILNDDQDYFLSQFKRAVEAHNKQLY